MEVWLLISKKVNNAMVNSLDLSTHQNIKYLNFLVQKIDIVFIASIKFSIGLLHKYGKNIIVRNVDVIR